MFPYPLYDAVNDSRTHPAHRLMDGIIKPIHDPFWATRYPPNGYRCRCTTVALTERQAAARGGVTQLVPPEAVPDAGWDYHGGEEAGAGIDKALAQAQMSGNAQLKQALQAKIQSGAVVNTRGPKNVLQSDSGTPVFGNVPGRLHGEGDSDYLYRVVRLTEDEIRPWKKEGCRAFDGSGSVIVQVVGKASEIVLSAEEKATMAGASVVFTHNHPSWLDNADDPSSWGGASFSRADVKFACEMEMAEMRAVSRGWRYSIGPPSGGWNLALWNSDLNKIFEIIQEEVRRDFREAVWSGTMARELAFSREMDEIWTRMARESGLGYRREPWAPHR